jgi:hypothetical protein
MYRLLIRPGQPDAAEIRRYKISKRTRSTASVGTATITPKMPPRPPPTITARKTRIGCTRSVSPWILGVRKLPSSC